jgi:ORF6N domain
MPEDHSQKSLIPYERIAAQIYLIRGQKVMLSAHLADLYGVEPRALVQAVKRNAARFPEDFMFQLSKSEFDLLKSQIVISSWGGARRAPPYAFTEQGVAMLSSVLRSDRAIKMNILIMRAFVKVRELLATNKNVARKLEEIERKQSEHERRIDSIVEVIEALMTEPVPPKRRIGFNASKKGEDE